jgi:hypothetical protein
VGCDTVEQLEMNVTVAKGFEPMDQKDQEVLMVKVRPYARELMYYKL